MARVPSNPAPKSLVYLLALRRRAVRRQTHTTALSAVAGICRASIAVVAGRAVWLEIVDAPPVRRERRNVGLIAPRVETCRAVKLLANVVDADAIIPTIVVVTTIDRTRCAW